MDWLKAGQITFENRISKLEHGAEESAIMQQNGENEKCTEKVTEMNEKTKMGIPDGFKK